MPQALTVEQKNFIRNIMDDLIPSTLPSEEKALRAEVKGLQLALEEKPLHASHPYAQLQQCYRNPAAFFLRLENYNPDISVGLVQQQMLQVLKELIDQAAPSGFTAESLDWNTQPHQKKLRFSTPFRTLRLARGHIWEMSDRDLIPVATLEEPVIKAFLAAKICEADTASALRPPALAVCKNPFYSQRILQGLIPFEEIQGLSPGQSALLNLPSMIHLQEQGKVRFSEAKTISPHLAPVFKSELCLQMIASGKLTLEMLNTLTAQQAALLANEYYAAEFYNDRLTLDEIRLYTPEDIDRLLLPALIMQQKKHGLSRAAAKKVSPSLFPLLGDEGYADFVLENKSAFSFFESLTPHQAGILLDPAVKPLVLSGNLPIEKAVNLNEHETRLLHYPAIQTLLKARKLEIEELRRVPLDFAVLLDENPCLCHLIAHGILSFQDCLGVFFRPTLENFYCTEMGLVFGGRLAALLKNRPYIHPNNAADSVALIQTELANLVAFDHHYHHLRAAICDQALKVYFRALQRILTLETQTQQNIYSPFYNILSQITFPDSQLLDNGDPRSSLGYLKQLRAMVDDTRQRAEALRAFRDTCVQGRGFLSSSLFMQTARAHEIQKVRNFLGLIDQAASFAELFQTPVPPRRVQCRRH